MGLLYSEGMDSMYLGLLRIFRCFLRHDQLLGGKALLNRGVTGMTLFLMDFLTCEKFQTIGKNSDFAAHDIR